MRQSYCFTGCALLLSVGLCLHTPSASGCGRYGLEQYQPWIDNALSEQPALASQGISKLRSAGPQGLKALARFETQLPQISGDVTQSEQAAKATAMRQRYLAALDEVGGQRDCRASRLYWYTDLELAKAAARETGRPILSLRLLGKLTDEFSCANSRFFRSTLYANDEVKGVLGSEYILHWESVRPVPKVTIDFGDGRKLERTLTGNSIHYVLDAEGRPIDALPGLYGPRAFMRGLAQAKQAFGGSQNLNANDRADYLREYHAARSNEILRNWNSDLQRVGAAIEVANESSTNRKVSMVVMPHPRATAPNAAVAGNLAITKRAVEMPILNATTRRTMLLEAASPQSASDPASAERATTSATTEVPSPELLSLASSDEVWLKIAALHANDAQLDQAGRDQIASKNPNARQAGALAGSKFQVEDPILRMVRNLEGSIALDTVKNEYLFRRQIHDWLATELATAGTPATRSSSIAENIDVLNERVYAQLFLTPSSDPWLGLMPADTYTAIENNGVVNK